MIEENKKHPTAKDARHLVRRYYHDRIRRIIIEERVNRALLDFVKKNRPELLEPKQEK